MSKGKLFLVLSAFLYGIAPVLAAFAYRGGVNGITLTFLRSAVSCPVLFMMLKANGQSIRINRIILKRVVVLALVGSALSILALYISYHFIATGLATTLHFVYPLIIVIASAVLYHERLSRTKLSAVVFVTVGIFMFSDITGGGDKTGIILAILSGIFYSFYVIYLDRSGLDRLDYILLTFYVTLITSVAILLYGILSGHLSFHISPMAWSMSAIISFIISFGAMPLFQLGVRHEGASAAGILSTIEPITSVILGALILDEHIGTGQIIGCAMIILGVILAEREPHGIKGTA